MQDLKDQNALLKTQKSGQMNGHSEQNSIENSSVPPSSKSTAELDSLKSELAQKDTDIAKLSAEVCAEMCENKCGRNFHFTDHLYRYLESISAFDFLILQLDSK